jgi:hypothetical protein
LKAKAISLRVDVVLHHETDKAFLVSTDSDRDKAKWIPKPNASMSAVVAVTVPLRCRNGWQWTVA